MKRIYLLILAVGFLFTGCKEEEIGQYAVDSDAPAQVSNVTVDNFKGFSEITYTIPNDKDLLYIAAIYTNESGETKEVRSSAYSNKLKIEGFAKAKDINVQLLSVDKSENRSAAVDITISPLDSPIYDIIGSMQLLEAFGGVKINWDNQTEEGIVVEVMLQDSIGEYQHIKSFYGSAKTGLGAVRGLPSEEQNFGVFIRDIYQNRTDTLKATLTPLFEEELDKSLHKTMPLSTKFKQSKWGGPQHAVWDGKTIVSGSGCFDILGNGVDNIYWTYDLGVTAKLSRFKMWARSTHFYKLAHPKHFQIWVTTDPEVAKDAESFDGWEMVLEVNATKVSGNDALGDITADDIAHATAGEEYEMNLPAPTARYIRFKTLETWGGSDRSWLAELTWWGEVLE